MVSGTLEMCSLRGWILVFTVQGRRQTACKACGWAVCWCQRCGSSGPWWRWGYGMGRRILWMNTGAFYWWHFEILWRDPEAHCCAIYPWPSPHIADDNAWLHVEGSVHNSWKLKTSQFLQGQYTHCTCPIEHVWDALDQCIQQCVPVTANIQQLHKAIEEATINNLVNSMQRRCVALHCVRQMVVTPDTDWFSDPPGHLLHILEWSLIVTSLRHTCAIIMPSNQNLDIHL